MAEIGVFGEDHKLLVDGLLPDALVAGASHPKATNVSGAWVLGLELTDQD